MTEKRYHITDNPDHSRFGEIFGDTPDEGTAEHAMYISRLMADDRREREAARLQRQREIAQKIAQLESDGYRKVSDSELKKLGFKYRCFVDEVSGYDDWYWAAPDGWDVVEIDGKVWVRNNSKPESIPKAGSKAQPTTSITKINKIKIWMSKDKKEARIYVETVDGRSGCYYKTGNHWHPKGSHDGDITSEEWEQAKALAVWDKRWHTIWPNEMSQHIHKLID